MGHTETRIENSHVVGLSRQEKVVLALAANIPVYSFNGRVKIVKVKIVKVKNGEYTTPKTRSWMSLDGPYGVDASWVIDGKPIDNYNFLWRPRPKGPAKLRIEELIEKDVILYNDTEQAVIQIKHRYHHHYGQRPATDYYEVWLNEGPHGTIFPRGSVVTRIVE